jgi:hypothetical protein
MNRPTRIGPHLTRFAAAGILPLFLAFGLAACEVEQTEEGDAPDVDIEAESGRLPEYEQTEEGELPDVDVNVKPGKLPKYDIDAPDVHVSLEKRTITVPKLIVVSEEEEVTIPHIDIDFPREEETEKSVAVEVEVPSSGYDIEIEEIYLIDNEYVVISRLERPSEPANGEISRVTDHAVITGPDLDVRHIIIGHKPDRSYNNRYEFVDSRQAIADVLQSGQRIYEREREERM